eukprot:13784344-Heterocapsa_arctica.AAC.1
MAMPRTPAPEPGMWTGSRGGRSVSLQGGECLHLKCCSPSSRQTASHKTWPTRAAGGPSPRRARRVRSRCPSGSA